MGRRGKTYIPYDYEAAYQEHMEKLEEEQIRQQLLHADHRTIYATKEIRAGEQLEVEIYPEFSKGDAIPDAGRNRKQREAQWNLNEKNSRKQCERVINANFGNGDIWATLTYTNENMPENMQEAQKNMRNYIKRLNRHRQKMGLVNTRYVYVTECSSKGRWHHHIVMDGDIGMDTVESVWKNGRRNQVRRLEKDENGLSGMAQYITKEKKEKGQKKWTASKGLKKPDERKNHYKFRNKDVREVAANVNVLEDKLKKWYAKEGYVFTSAEVRYNDYNGRWYIYARMRIPQAEAQNRKSNRKRD